LCLRTDALSSFALEERFEISQEIVRFCGGILVLDVVGSIVIHAIEIVGTFHESYFFWSKCGKTVAKLLYHGGGVVAKVDRVCKPGDRKLEFAFCGFDIKWIRGVPWVHGVTCL
jgi:hypothetical protein